MEDIDLIYYNNYGTSFYLKRCTVTELNKIQLVFNKVAFLITKEELFHLKNIIKSSISVLEQVNNFIDKQSSIEIILEINHKEIHVNLSEINAFDELINGTLFFINFEKVMNNLLSV